MADLNPSELDAALPDDIGAALFAALATTPVSQGQAQRIRRKIDAGVARISQSPSTATADTLAAAPVAHAPAVTHRLREGPWLPASPGLEIKIVNFDRVSGLHSYFARLQPGTTIHAHAHHRVEECAIVAGEIEVDGLTLGVGDYQVFEPGTRHNAIHTRDGALLFIRAELELHT
jgi:anti-sigma factor ChrR (cupin superfamily)